LEPIQSKWTFTLTPFCSDKANGSHSLSMGVGNFLQQWLLVTWVCPATQHSLAICK